MKKYAKYPVKFGSIESTGLMLSSCLFLFPAMYALIICKMYFYAIVSIITSLVSINYWRHADYGRISRTVDLIVAKVSFAIYFASGLYFSVHNPILFIYGIPGLCGIVFFYRYSIILWEYDAREWYLSHMSFHLFVALEQMLVIYGGKILK
jgi:hypothetical protein